MGWGSEIAADNRNRQWSRTSIRSVRPVWGPIWVLTPCIILVLSFSSKLSPVFSTTNPSGLSPEGRGCGHAAHTLRIRCVYAAHTLHIRCTYAANTLHIHDAHMLRIRCAYTMHIRCKYAAHVRCTCTLRIRDAHMLRIRCAYTAHIPHTQVVLGQWI